jgi:ATP-dependent DNA helicase RecG
VPGAQITDLDLARFRAEYLPSAFPPEILAENRRAEVDQLTALRLLTRNGAPTVTAMIVLGIEPRLWLAGAYVQFVRYDGAEVTDPIRAQKEISGTLTDQLREVDAILLGNISLASDFSNHREVRFPDYPIVALQELIRNAVIHRSYEGTNAPTRITWYTDRIEILSPGGPYGQVNADNFGQPNIADYRNPAIAEAAKILGFAQRFGMGISKAQAELRRNGNPPAAFVVLPTHVLVTVRPRQ